MAHSFPKHAAAFLGGKAEVFLRGKGNKKPPRPGGGRPWRLIEGQRPGEGGRPLPGLTRRGTSQLSDYGVIRRRWVIIVAANEAFQGKKLLQIGNVKVSGEHGFW